MGASRQPQPGQPGNGSGWTMPGWASSTAMLVFGTSAAILTKAAYELEGVGADGLVAHFEKPWALTAVMFAGMSLCLPLAYGEKLAAARAAEAAARADAGGEAGPAAGRAREEGLGDALRKVFDAAEARDAAVLAAPALLDLAATGAQYYGLLSITASVYQMLRGAMLVFAALFGVTFLKRHLNGKHLGGIAATLAGISVVGAASVLSGEGSLSRDVPQAEILVGLGACVLGQCLQAAQVTLEDYLLSHSEARVSPLKVVGYEGLIGGAATLLVVLPLLSAVLPEAGALSGLREDLGDTVAMVRSNPAIGGVLLADLVAFAGLNLSGMVVISQLGGVYKTVLETARTLFVWLAGLGLFYSGLGGGVVGESWNDYSPVQAVGFAVTVAGTLLYASGNAAADAADAAPGDAGAPAAAGAEGARPQPRGGDAAQCSPHAAAAAREALLGGRDPAGGAGPGPGPSPGPGPLLHPEQVPLVQMQQSLHMPAAAELGASASGGAGGGVLASGGVRWMEGEGGGGVGVGRHEAPAHARGAVVQRHATPARRARPPKPLAALRAGAPRPLRSGAAAAPLARSARVALRAL